MMARSLPAMIVVLAGLAMMAGAQPPAGKNPPLTIAQLRERGVIGDLGIPLGEIAEIQATIISGDSLRNKADQGKYLLQVDSVNGKALVNPATIRFSPEPGVKLASDHYSLYELKKGHKTGRLSSNEIEEIEKDYVGTRVKLEAYESGSFTGLPTNRPENAPLIAAPGFHFRNYLVIEQLK